MTQTRSDDGLKRKRINFAVNNARGTRAGGLWPTPRAACALKLCSEQKVAVGELGGENAHRFHRRRFKRRLCRSTETGRDNTHPVDKFGFINSTSQQLDSFAVWSAICKVPVIMNRGHTS